MTVTIKAKHWPVIVIAILLTFSIGSAHPEAGLLAGAIGFYMALGYFVAYVAYVIYVDHKEQTKDQNGLMPGSRVTHKLRLEHKNGNLQ